MPKRLGTRKLSNTVPNTESPSVNTESATWSMPGYEKLSAGSEQVKLYNPNDFLHPQHLDPTLQQQQNHLQPNYVDWNLPPVTTATASNIHTGSSMDNAWSWPQEVHNGQPDPWNWNTSSSSSPATAPSMQVEWNNNDYSSTHGNAGHAMWDPSKRIQIENAASHLVGREQHEEYQAGISLTATTTQEQQLHQQQVPRQMQPQQSWDFNPYSAQQPYVDILNVPYTNWQPVSTGYQWTNQHSIHSEASTVSAESLNKNEHRESIVGDERNAPSIYSQSNMQTSTSVISTGQIIEPTIVSAPKDIVESNKTEESNEESLTDNGSLRYNLPKANCDTLQVQTTLSSSHPHLFERSDSWLSGSSLQTFHNSLSGSQDLLDGSYFMPPEAVEAVRQHMASLSVKSDVTAVEDDQKSPELTVQTSSTEVDNNSKNEEIPSEAEVSASNNPLPGNQESMNVDSSLREENVNQPEQMNNVSDTVDRTEVSLQSQLACNNESIRQPPDGAAAIRPMNVATGRANMQSAAVLSNALSSSVNVSTSALGTEANSSDKLSTERILPDSENMENPKLPMKSSASTSGKLESFPHHLNVYGGLISPREGSPFKPLVKSAASIPSIIQHELPDNHNSQSQNSSKVPDHGANLEMTPDNAERPSDLDHTNPEVHNETKENILLPHGISKHESHLRNRRELNNDSPSTTLWNNPEPKQANVILLPVASNPPVSQNILIVPSLSDKVLDNPLGKNVVQENNSSENIEDISLEMKNNTNDEQCFKENLYDSIGLKTSQNNVNPATSTPVSSSIIQNENLSMGEKDKSKSKPPVNLEETVQQESSVNNCQIANIGQSCPNSKNQTESISGDAISSIHSRGQRPPVPGLGPVQPPRALSEPPGSQSVGSHSVNNYDGKEGDPLYQRKQDDNPYPLKDVDERYDRHRNTDYNKEKYPPPDSYPDYRPPPQNYDDTRMRDSRDKRRDYGRDRYYERDDSYRYRDDRYYLSERDRSRPSSRPSSRGSMDYEYDRHYQGSKSRDPYEEMHRGGYDSDRENSYYKNYNYPSYDHYQQDPRYYKDYDYGRYERDRYYQRYYSDPYYGYNNYNYGYYDELYRNDPLFRAQYEAQYRDYYARQGYSSSDRRSVQSGRSSVNDEIQRDRNQASQGYIHNDPHLQSGANAAYEQTMYGDYSQKENFHEFDNSSFNNKRLTPVKFHMPHVKIQFTSAGQLIKILPNNPNEGQPASLEIHDIQVLFSGNAELEELKIFPGPLERNITHKNDVIQFCCDKIKKAKENPSLHDRDSYSLIWELLILLIRQNGSVVGTDIAELLLRDHECLVEEPLGSKNASSDNLSKEDTVASDASFLSVKDCSTINKSTEEKVTQKFREYLLFGHKKEALERAMKNGLWGHALFLASKMDARTHANVMTRFANSLRLNDPLQTLYQLMSGRQPAAVTCVAEEKWGDWRPHLAMILSNTSNRPELDRKSIMILGDTLATRGCLHASQFCYLMAQMEFGTYSSKSSKLVLLGSNHSLPFSEFATSEAIQCTEIYEFALSLANPDFLLPHFQSYRFIYATRLAEYGLSQEALHYCEVISSRINKNPVCFHPDMVIQVYELANKLKYFDPCYTNNEGEISEVDDPQWLQQLRISINSYNNGNIEQDIGSLNSSYLAENLTNESSAYMQHHSTTSEGYYNLADIAQTESAYSNDQLEQRSSVGHQNNYSLYGNQPLTESQTVYSSNQSEFQQSQLENSSSYNENSTSYLYTNDSQINYNYYNQPEHPGFASSQDTSNNFNNNNNNQSQEMFSQNQTSSEDYWDMSTKMASSSPPVSSASDFKNVSTNVNRRRTSSGSNRTVPSDKPEDKKENKTKPSGGSNGGWLGGIFNKFMPKPKNQMKLPDDRNPTIIWDPKLNRWVNTEEDDEETNPVASPPPMDSEILKTIPQANKENIMPTANHGDFNKFRRSTARGTKQRYVDVVSKGGMTTATSNVVPQNLIPTMDSPLINPSQLLIPTSVPGNETEAAHYVTGDQAQVTTMESQSDSPLHRNDTDRNEPPVPSIPVMFNPMQMPLPTSQASQAKTSRIGRNRYPH